MRLSILALSVHPVAFRTKARLSYTLLSVSNLKSWNTTPNLRRSRGISSSVRFLRLKPTTFPCPLVRGKSP